MPIFPSQELEAFSDLHIRLGVFKLCHILQSLQHMHGQMREGVIINPPHTQHLEPLRGEPCESHVVGRNLDSLEVRVKLPDVPEDLKVLEFELSVLAVVVGVREIHSHGGRVDSQQIHHGLVLAFEGNENPSHQDGYAKLTVPDENQLEFLRKVRFVVRIYQIYKFGDSEFIQV